MCDVLPLNEIPLYGIEHPISVFSAGAIPVAAVPAPVRAMNELTAIVTELGQRLWLGRSRLYSGASSSPLRRAVSFMNSVRALHDLIQLQDEHYRSAVGPLDVERPALLAVRDLHRVVFDNRALVVDPVRVTDSYRFQEYLCVSEKLMALLRGDDVRLSWPDRPGAPPVERVVNQRTRYEALKAWQEADQTRRTMAAEVYQSYLDEVERWLPELRHSPMESQLAELGRVYLEHRADTSLGQLVEATTEVASALTEALRRSALTVELLMTVAHREIVQHAEDPGALRERSHTWRRWFREGFDIDTAHHDHISEIFDRVERETGVLSPDERAVLRRASETPHLGRGDRVLAFFNAVGMALAVSKALEEVPPSQRGALTAVNRWGAVVHTTVEAARDAFTLFTYRGCTQASAALLRPQLGVLRRAILSEGFGNAWSSFGGILTCLQGVEEIQQGIDHHSDRQIMLGIATITSGALATVTSAALLVQPLVTAAALEGSAMASVVVGAASLQPIVVAVGMGVLALHLWAEHSVDRSIPTNRRFAEMLCDAIKDQRGCARPGHEGQRLAHRLELDALIDRVKNAVEEESNDFWGPLCHIVGSPGSVDQSTCPPRFFLPAGEQTFADRARARLVFSLGPENASIVHQLLWGEGSSPPLSTATQAPPPPPP
jgi:hypothetical protein